MKTLKDHTDQAYSNLFEQTGAFFAFGIEQLNESKREGEKYTTFGGGLFVPTANAQKLIDGWNRISKDSIAQDLKENGKESIIRRELFNYECFYTGCILDCVDALKKYGITAEEIEAQYRYMRANEDVGL